MPLENQQPFLDITTMIDESLSVFEGDAPFKSETVLSFEKGHHLTLMRFSATTHLGTHADAPIHYHKDGVTSEHVSILDYMGPCYVADLAHYCEVKNNNNLIKAEWLNHALSECQRLKISRLLVKTNSFLDDRKWTTEFYAFEADAIEACAQSGIKLIGIDTPSIDYAESKNLLSHQAVYQHDMRILEGLRLDEVKKEGAYILICLPMKLKGMDASMVRATLWSKESFHQYFG